MAGVSVMGIVKPMGGLKESQVAFRKHWAETGDALLNIAAGIDKDDPRPAYVHQEWPTMVYHAVHGEKLVGNKEELAEALASGWRREQFIKPQVAVLDPATEKKELQRQNAELQGQISTLAARIEFLMGEHEKQGTEKPQVRKTA